MSARITALLSAGALLAAAQPALADDHIVEIEAETVLFSEDDMVSDGAPYTSVDYAADLPIAPQGYRWVRADEQDRQDAPRFGYGDADRRAWLTDCSIMLSERQYDADDYYDDDAGGGLIGGLLGAVVGGVAGNRIADGDRLLGTIIGGGIGGIAGAVLGTALDSEDENEYDGYEIDPYAAEYCAAYLRRYEAQGMGAIGGHGSSLIGTTYRSVAHSSHAPVDRVMRRKNCRSCGTEVIEEIIIEEPVAARAIPPRSQPAPTKTKLLSVK